MVRSTERARIARRPLALLVGVATPLLLAGCSSETLQRGYLPGNSDEEITNHTGRIVDLWNGSWIAALAVGLIVWGLTIWCVVAYRRRKDDADLPAQVRYNVPLEIMYTVIPLMMVAVLFYFTARDQAVIEEIDDNPDHVIEVVGKQWAWDFNYLDEDVYSDGVQASLTGERGVEENLPTLYLPRGERIQLLLESRDVNHSFWVPSFLYKKDLIPGRQNQYSFIPEVEGTYQGKCAELCGQSHAEMLFNVKVVSPQEYQDYTDDLRDQGNVGRLGVDLGKANSNTVTAVEDEIGETSTDSQGEVD